MNDYKERKYLSSIESAKYLGITVRTLHTLIRANKIKSTLSSGGQKRFHLKDLKIYEQTQSSTKSTTKAKAPKKIVLKIQNTVHKIYTKSAVNMNEIKDNSIHLMVTSPPYFNAKMYTKQPLKGDLGNIHDLNEAWN